MKKSSLSLAAALLAGASIACAAGPDQKAEPKKDAKPAAAEVKADAKSAVVEDKSGLKDDEKVIYALGLVISRNLANFALSPAELEILKLGLTDGTLNREKKVDLEAYGPRIAELAKARTEVAAGVEKNAGQTYLEKAAGEKGAKKTASGLVYTELKAGVGPSPKATDKVKVHYEGKLTDGTIFDSSVKRNEPATFPLNGVIKCWTEGVQLMKVGGKSRLTCPSDLAYGDNGAPPKIKPGATLTFEVELLEIVK